MSDRRRPHGQAADIARPKVNSLKRRSLDLARPPTFAASTTTKELACSRRSPSRTARVGVVPAAGLSPSARLVAGPWTRAGGGPPTGPRTAPACRRSGEEGASCVRLSGMSRGRDADSPRDAMRVAWRSGYVTATRTCSTFPSGSCPSHARTPRASHSCSGALSPPPSAAAAALAVVKPCTGRQSFQ